MQSINSRSQDHEIFLTYHLSKMHEKYINRSMAREHCLFKATGSGRVDPVEIVHLTLSGITSNELR